MCGENATCQFLAVIFEVLKFQSLCYFSKEQCHLILVVGRGNVYSIGIDWCFGFIISKYSILSTIQQFGNCSLHKFWMLKTFLWVLHDSAYALHCKAFVGWTRYIGMGKINPLQCTVHQFAVVYCMKCGETFDSIYMSTSWLAGHCQEGTSITQLMCAAT